MHYRMCISLYVFANLCLASDDFTLRQTEDYANLRDCAKTCFSHGASATFEVFDTILEATGCTTHRVNSCACRGDLQFIALESISKCALSACTKNQKDVALATKLYENYCTSAGYTRDSTVATTSIVQQSVATVAVTRTAFVTSATGQSSGASSSVETSTVSEWIFLLISLPVSSRLHTPWPIFDQCPLSQTVLIVISILANSISLSSTMTSETIVVTSSSDSPSPSSSATATADGGLTHGDKIALGTGLSIPVVSLFVAILIWRFPKHKHRYSFHGITSWDLGGRTSNIEL